MSYERPNIRRMQGYAWGEQPSDGRTVKLNTNENPYPPSPRVQQALQAFAADSLRTYPQPTADPLRDVLAELHGLDRDHVLITHGGDEALRLAVTTFVDPGGGFGMAEPSYSLYPVLAEVQDAHTVRVALGDDWQLPDDTAAQLNAAAVRLTCLVNPHAPSGRLTPAAQLLDIARALDGVLLVDEAYVDFAAPERAYELAARVREVPNLLVLRTFSKGYSLAGLRLGYLLGAPGVIDPMLSKTRDSYNVDAISQALGIAALHDRAYAEDTWRRVREARQGLQDGLNQLGIHTWPSDANFVLARLPAAAPIGAAELYRHLKVQGILVRHFALPRLTDCLRISVGTPEQNQRLIDGIAEALHG